MKIHLSADSSRDIFEDALLKWHCREFEAAHYEYICIPLHLLGLDGHYRLFTICGIGWVIQVWMTLKITRWRRIDNTKNSPDAKSKWKVCQICMCASLIEAGLQTWQSGHCLGAKDKIPKTPIGPKVQDSLRVNELLWLWQDSKFFLIPQVSSFAKFSTLKKSVSNFYLKV